MYYDVYIDIVFLTNLLMDYVLLCIVGKLFLRKRNRGRILLAAAVGALFSCLILYILPDMIFPAKVLLHGGCAWGMLVLGLDLKKNGLLVKALVTVYLMAFFMGGLMEAAPVKKTTPIRFLIVAAGAYMGLSALIYLSDSVLSGKCTTVFRALGYRKFSCRPHQPEGGIYYKTGGSGSIASAGKCRQAETP